MLQLQRSSRLTSLAMVSRCRVTICTQQCSFSDYVQTIKQTEAEKAKQRKHAAELENKNKDLHRRLQSLHEERERLNTKLLHAKQLTDTGSYKRNPITDNFFIDPVGEQDSQDQVTESEKVDNFDQKDVLKQLHEVDDEQIFIQEVKLERLTDPEQIRGVCSKVHAYLQIGKELKRNKKSREAIDVFRQAIELEQIARNKPEVLAELWTNIAWIYCSVRKSHAAFKAAGIAMELNPNNPSSYEIFGIMYKHVGDRFKAKIYLKKAIDLDPNRTKAKTMLDKLQ